MYETEANHRVESIQQIPSEVQRQFCELGRTILARTTLPWGEHCTECVWPTCYTTCDLYSPREDKRCRRFVDGMVRIDCPDSPNNYLLKISFKRWGKLWSPGNVRLYTPDEAQKRERQDHVIGATLHRLPLPAVAKRVATGLRYNSKKRVARDSRPSDQAPTSFVVECYNPGNRSVPLSLTLRATNEPLAIPFQKLLDAQPGFARFRVAVDEMPAALLRAPFDVELIPNDIADGTTLCFGLIDFVREASTPPNRPDKVKTVKCVVWDLDHTMWDGILVEDGPSGLTLKPGIVEVIQELDRRGILNSIASKNNLQEAWPVLENFGIASYFLVPQISWSPKSQALEAIAADLNIDIDTLLFIDDSPFELEQVKTTCPDVRVVVAPAYLSLLDRPDCQVTITAEASSRRKMYQDDSARRDVAQQFEGDYLRFLKQCGLELTIRSLADENIERVHELTQRTNQMNFSGTRYSRSVLEGILGDPDIDTYVLSCRDRFGSYGVVGFSVVDRREPRMTDLMFSCRIQSKRVEHAFLAHLLRRYIDECGGDVWANYRKTPRNEPSGRVFSDIGMEEVSVNDGVTSLVFRKERPILDDGIVTITNECTSDEPSRT